MNPSHHPLPVLRLPSALLRFWPAGGDDSQARQLARTFAGQPGVVQLEERLLAILPEKARENIFDDALAIGQAMLAELRRLGSADEISGILIFPGDLRVDGASNGGSVTAIEDELIVDLREKSPRFKSPGLFLTGYAASWLRGRFQFDSAGLFDGPSGRRVPIHRVLGEAPQLGPWHNPELLGRQVKVQRPDVRMSLEAAKEGVLRINGPLGTGKSHLAWHFLLDQEGPKLWFRVRRSLFGTAGLARRLVTELQKLAPESLPADGGELRQPENLTPVRAAELLSVWLDNTCRQLGATLWIACDVIQSAVDEDLDLLANLLARRGSVFRMLLISRSGGPVISQLVDLPQVEVPPMSEEEYGSLCQQMFAGLSMGDAIENRMREAANGYPFALEEGLTDLVHRGLVKRVYGSFFYSGPSDIDYNPSRRLVRHVAAEVERLGESLPLRILAAAGQAVPPEALTDACNSFGVEMAPGWHHAFTGAGWLGPSSSAWGEGLDFVCPAYGRSLLDTVAEESVEHLRQALGQAMISETSQQELTWQTYQLMEGSVEAVSSLIQLSKKADTPEARQELFQALEKEYRLHVSRSGDPATELEILWKLLPLGHRIGRLNQLEKELSRALELAVNDPTRFAALALVKAEHDQDEGRPQEAIKGVQSALMAAEGGDDQRRALIVIRLGVLFLRQERMDDVRRIFGDLLRLAGKTSVGATCRYHLGEAALFERDLEKAEKYHRRALKYRREHGPVKAQSASLSANGNVALAIGDYPTALSHFQEAEKILSGEGPEELATALLGQGRVRGMLGHATAGSAPLRRALEILEDRGTRVDIEVARMALARNHFDLEQYGKALELAREAHFKLSLLPASSLLADGAQLIGEILFQMQQPEEAEDHFKDAMRLHFKQGRRQSAAFDSSWLLELALARADRPEITRRSTDLEPVVEGLVNPIHGELLHFRLFKAFWWLRERGEATRDPIEYLRAGHRELMRKLGYLDPQDRNEFLFNVKGNQDILNKAVEHDLSMPSFSGAALVS